jgi:hypothetical protein
MGRGVGQRRQKGRLAQAAPGARVPSVTSSLGGGTLSLAWICHNRRMAKDYERLSASGEAFVYAAMSRLPYGQGVGPHLRPFHTVSLEGVFSEVHIQNPA